MPTQFHLADAWEAIADSCPDRPALIGDAGVRTWREFDDRSARLAAALDALALPAGFRAVTYLHNGNALLEAQFAVFKAGGCPLSVDYRYKSHDLVALLDRADCDVVFFPSTYAARIWEIRRQLPRVRAFVQIDDGTEMLIDGAVDFETAILTSAPMPRIDRDANAPCLFYTGGAIDLPNVVRYRTGDIGGAMVAAAAAALGEPVPESAAELARLAAGNAEPPVTLAGCPLMHATGMWLGAFVPLCGGGTVVTSSRIGFDADRIWALAEAHAATDVIIAGEPFARPLLDALDDASDRAAPYDLRSLRRVTSSSVMWRKETRSGLLAHLDVCLEDVLGAAEGIFGRARSTREANQETGCFVPESGVRVLADTGAEVAWGSGEAGRLAVSFPVPLGYCGSAADDAGPVVEIDGVAHGTAGDYATVLQDGTVQLLGRGVTAIATADGRVFAEQVEEIVKGAPGVADGVVVGVPDGGGRQTVTAVVAAGEDADVDAEGVIEFARSRLAAHAVPDRVLRVASIRRSPSGKPDYRWARSAAQAPISS